MDIYADNTEFLLEAINICLDGTWTVDKISINPTYRLTREDGYSLKAKFLPTITPIENHELFQEAGVRVPKLEYVIQADENAHNCYIMITEWITGTCYMNAMTDPVAMGAIPPGHYIELGKLLSTLNNITVKDRWMSMNDLIWGQFVFKDGKVDQLYLIDSNKAMPLDQPTRFYRRIFSHRNITAESKRRFIDGYMSVWKPRPPTPGETAQMLFLVAMRKKT